MSQLGIEWSSFQVFHVGELQPCRQTVGKAAKGRKWQALQPYICDKERTFCVIMFLQILFLSMKGIHRDRSKKFTTTSMKAYHWVLPKPYMPYMEAFRGSKRDPEVK
jgi:hypothetical protein